MPGQTKKYGLGRATNAIELDLPSGNTCLVIRPGVQGLIKHGLLDSLDTLTSLVQINHIDSKDPKAMAKAVNDFAQDPKKILEASRIIDQVLCYVVHEPKVLMPPESDSERDPGSLYADEVDEEDKLFIFQYVVGGTRDIESFREQSKKLMDGIQPSEDVPLPS